MATTISTTEDENLPSPVEEDEDVVVKSKNDRTDIIIDDSSPLGLEAHIDTPPNGGIVTPDSPSKPRLMLEVAETDATVGGDDAGISSDYRLWDSGGQFGLSGEFKIQGKRKTMVLEDDMLQWTSKNKPSDKETLSLADIFIVDSIPTRGQTSHEANKFKIHALRSQPGTCGELLELVCQPMDPHPAATTQTWVDHLNQQIQNFGHRPRRVYVIINPTCGSSSGWNTWIKVEPFFVLAHVHTEVIVTQRRFHAREIMQSLDLTLYDGVILVGGDGLFNEAINGLMLQAQQSAGINIRRSRFVPVQPNIRLGIIPAGFLNSIAWSILGTRCPLTAAAQILLGCSSPMDVSSLSNNGQLLLFSGGAISYGLMSEVSVYSRDFTWLGDRRLDVAQLRAVIYNRDFEAEVSYIPVEDQNSILTSKEKCYSRCTKCNNYDGPLETPSVINEKGASVMAAYSNVDRVTDDDWKKVSGVFSTVIACPLTCRSQQSHHGMSPWAHQANGCTDLILVRQSSKMELVKWLIRQRRTMNSLDLPNVEIQRVKEFKFREILTPFRRREEEESLVTEEREDDDEVTNRRGGSRLGRQPSRDQTIHPTSHWSVDGDDLNRSDIEVRVHRHMLLVFARGIEPLISDVAGESPNESVGSTTESSDRIVQQLIPPS